MTCVAITCDKRKGIRRVAVWENNVLRDLYLDSVEKPDLTGAIVGGKVVRTLAGQQSIFVDCGLDEFIYAESSVKYSTGQYVALRLTKMGRHGKGWRGAVYNENLAQGKVGILSAPPYLWQRAVTNINNTKIESISFADQLEFKICQEWMAIHSPASVNKVTFVKESSCPDLDDELDRLKERTVALIDGSEIVIEPTEALVAIDVNAAQTANPLSVNLLAVKEIARQIRLRNLSGIFVVDALKLKHRPDKAKILNALAKAAAHDPAGVTVFGITKLGLIEFTRTRIGYGIHEIE